MCVDIKGELSQPRDLFVITDLYFKNGNDCIKLTGKLITPSKTVGENNTFTCEWNVVELTYVNSKDRGIKSICNIDEILHIIQDKNMELFGAEAYFDTEELSMIIHSIEFIYKNRVTKIMFDQNV